MNKTTWRLLLVEDDEDDYLLTRDILQECTGIQVTLDWVTTCEAAIDALAEKNYDAGLIDYRLGEHTGLDVLHAAHQSGNTVPLIILTGHGHQKTEVDARKMGASDYISKNQLRSNTLERKLKQAIGINASTG